MKPVYLLIMLATLIFPAQAQVVLETVPRQGGMLMPEVWYHTDTTNVTVDLSALYDVNGQPIIAQLTPLLVSDPGASFDPASPWYAYLDPSQQGLAFTRRYGYDMELSFFDYQDTEYNPTGSAPTWNPILGTAGTSNAVYWNQGMWHMAVTARPAPTGTTNYYSATIEIYVVDADTGQEVPNSGYSFPLIWSDVPDGRPPLAINPAATNNIQLSWPASTATNWQLVSATNLNTPNWTAVTNPVVVTTNLFTVTLKGLSRQQFFRMEFFP